MKSETNKDYLYWLVGLVEQGAPSRRKYRKLSYILFDKEFTWTVPNDGNRIGDGKALREVYSREFECEELEDFPCSVLEVLVSIAYRMEDMLYNPEKGNRTLKWLWTLIKNLGLEYFTDDAYLANPDSFGEAIDEILETLIDRTYDRKGNGGLFPLRKPRTDQRKVEIWYQMQEFLEENYG